jgi:pimeloyl-ACP methyl ester carboxylesterase
MVVDEGQKKEQAQPKKGRRGAGDGSWTVLRLSTEEKARAAWAGLQAELVRLSPDGKQVIAEGASHFVHLDRPELVIDAIREVVQGARQGVGINP